ncbi:hypothetical protein [Paenibacillus segetis]|uniref:Lipoprotein n=1 Tax=Paenibacillus segetis TaxID=1325360 RepID=A0ABQ1YKZ8_9BACL|nr:hypothetical protein [Paenibacillus segetis]GGH28472.1 hypothetical protein GCM10008013_30500 [Paenibacillus segetis]
MRIFLHLCYISISLLVLVGLSACNSGNSSVTAKDVQKALEKQGLEVTQINVGTAEQGENSSLQLEGVFPEAFDVTLPTADLANPEYVFVYQFSAEKEAKSAKESVGISSLRMVDLHPNVAQKKNIVVIYWSQTMEKPLMINQFTKAMDKL